VTGGTLRPGAPSYVTRRADTELYVRLLTGDFCYVLTARQMGKSSLMASTAKRLEGEGVRTAIVDLTQIGTERGAADANQWYFGVAYEIHKKLGIAESLRSWWQERADLPAVQRLTEFFRELVLAHCPGRVVVFVDEIDSTIGLPFADDFFAAIRACYNARATDPVFERLTFVLLGVASPDQLIQDRARTPFNVGHRIDLTDFTLGEACPLAAGLHPDSEVAAQRLERVFHWTGGHPYLTQSLCRAAEERSAETASPEAIVDPLAETLFLSSLAQREENNLKYARARLTPGGVVGRRLLRLYLRVREGQKVLDEPTSPLFAQLKLVGVVKVGDDGNFAVRNRIYEAVFTPEWVKSEMPADRGLQLAAAILAAAVIGLLFYYEASYPRIYVRQLKAATESDAYAVAAEAYGTLRSIPFWRSQAAELMAQFWDQRALQQAALGHRDESLLSRLKAIEVKDTTRRRKEAQALVGDDYAELQGTFRSPTFVTDLAFSPDGHYVLAASPDGSVRSWSRDAGRTLRQVKPARRWPDTEDFFSVRLGADGRSLLTVDGQGRFEKMDLETDRLIESVSTGLLVPVGLASFRRFSQDGRYIVGNEPGRGWCIWDRGAKRRLDFPSAANPLNVAFSLDRKMASITNDTIRIWSLNAPQFLGSPIQQKGVTDIEFSGDGGLVLTSDVYGAVRIWNWKTGEPVGPLLRHGEEVTSLATSPDNGLLLTGGRDKAVRIWQNRGSRPQGVLLQKGIPGSVAFRANGPGILIISGDGTVGLQEFGGEQVRALWRLVPNLQSYLAPGGQFVLEAIGSATCLRVAETGRIACPFPKEVLAAFSPDGQTVAILGPGGVRLWNAKSCKPLAPATIFRNRPYEASFSLDGKLLAAVDNVDRTLRVIDARSGQLNQVFSLPVSVVLVAFSQDKRTLLIVDMDGGVRLWSRSSGKPMPPLFKARLNSVGAIVFHPDGRSFIVATERWLYSFSLEGNTPSLRSARLLRGSWMDAFRFVPGCDDCLEAIEGYSDSFFVEKIHFDEPDNPPIQGTPKELLAHWQKVLGLQFDGKTGAFLPL
jgi:WD40 repeat protein